MNKEIAYNCQKKNQLKCWRHKRRKKALENLTLTKHIKGKRSKGKQQINDLICLAKWLEAQVTQKIIP